MASSQEDDDATLAVFAPPDTWSTFESIANTASVAYNFSMKHKGAEDSTTGKDIKMSGTTVFAFPMRMQEFAFVLPNSRFASAGATWEEASTRPQLSSNRTTVSCLQDGSEKVPMPVHSFSMTSDGNCTLSIPEIDLLNVPSECHGLYSRSALLYAGEIQRRFVWTATERSGSNNRFELTRSIPDYTNGLEAQHVGIPSSAAMVPHSISLRELNYTAISSQGFRSWLEQQLGNSKERDMYDRRRGAMTPEELQNMRRVDPTFREDKPPTDPLPPPTEDSVGMWDNEAVQRILSERLRLWNEHALDRSEQPMFRTRNRAQQSRKVAAQQPDDGGIQHTFFRPVGGRRNSQLMRCEIKVHEYKIQGSIAAPADKEAQTMTADDFVKFLYRLSRIIPDNNRDGIRSPLFQRFRVLMASEETRDLLKLVFVADASSRLSEKSTESEKKKRQETFSKLVHTCAENRALYALAEVTTVLYKFGELVTDDSPLLNKYPALLWIVQKADERLSSIHDAVARALVPYPKFSAQVQEWMRLDVSSPVWTEYGGTRPPVAVSITITAHGFGYRQNSLLGVSPTNIDVYKPALVACLSRMIFDPVLAGIRSMYP